MNADGNDCTVCLPTPPDTSGVTDLPLTTTGEHHPRDTTSHRAQLQASLTIQATHWLACHLQNIQHCAHAPSRRPHRARAREGSPNWSSLRRSLVTQGEGIEHLAERSSTSGSRTLLAQEVVDL